MRSVIKLNAFRKLERWLDALDATAWLNLRKRADPLLLKRESGRGWQALFDLLSEARAFGYLLNIGCTEVHFIERTKKKTPDLGASQDGRVVFCEVKTINISDVEAQKRKLIQSGGRTSPTVGESFLKKLRAKLAEAVEQLDAADPKRQACRMIFTMLNFDDRVGDCQPQYITQIDEYLLQHPEGGEAELVFCLWSNLFKQHSFMMKSATILAE